MFPLLAHCIGGVVVALSVISATAAAAQAPRAGVITLRDQPGGFILEHKRFFEAIEASGDNVEIRGSCVSGCTLVLVYIPKERLCFHKTAWLGFHLLSTFAGPDIKASQELFDSYPQDIRTWFQKKGGIEKMPYGKRGGAWPIFASELWEMGYRKC